jgi:hypothetical protein
LLYIDAQGGWLTLGPWFENVVLLPIGCLVRFFVVHCSPVNPLTNIGPLILVLAVSLMKEAFEDRVSAD